MKWNEADWLMYYADECYVCIGQIIHEGPQYPRQRPPDTNPLSQDWDMTVGVVSQPDKYCRIQPYSLFIGIACRKKF